MRKVITYGTYDMLHRGHVRLLERAKALGDYLIVGVTSDDFDRQRGKVNVRQTLAERMDAVRSTGLADEVIVEEYPGQKIDDIRRYGVDVFTVGSDWIGEFDYLREWCEVVYLDRTKGISSSQIRSEGQRLRLGIVGSGSYVDKVIRQADFVNGIEVTGQIECGINNGLPSPEYEELLSTVDAVYVRTHPSEHFDIASLALQRGKHVLCESPAAIGATPYERLVEVAKENGVVLVDAVKTAYATAFERMLLLVKSGGIGRVVSVDATCTSLRGQSQNIGWQRQWGSAIAWGPTALLPIFRLLGTNYSSMRIWSAVAAEDESFDLFTKMEFEYHDAVASAKVGKGAKSEGELVITGTAGYVYVPAPWWKTDYFEVRYEDSSRNRRYFYQLDGEGIRYELVSFLRTTETGGECPYSPHFVSQAIAEVMAAVGDDQRASIVKVERWPDARQ